MEMASLPQDKASLSLQLAVREYQETKSRAMEDVTLFGILGAAAGYVIGRSGGEIALACWRARQCLLAAPLDDKPTYQILLRFAMQETHFFPAL